MKKYEMWFSLLKIPLDFLIVFCAFYLARDIRLVADFLPFINLPIQTIDNINLLKFAITWGLLYVFIFSMHNLYSLKITSSKIKELIDVVRYSIYWFIFYSAIIYFSKDFVYEFAIPRLVVWYTLILSIIFAILSRIFLNIFQNILLKRWILDKRKIVLITKQKDKNIKQILEDINRSWVYNLLWYSNTKQLKTSKLNYVWDIEELKNLMKNRLIDEVILLDSNFTKKELYEIWDYSRIYGIRYRYVTNNFDVTKTNTEVSLLHEIPLIEIKNTPLDAWWKVWKRFFDTLVSGIAFVLLLPFFIVIAILIKIEDPSGPVIYKNRRVGQKWKEFFLYKFRYMKWKYCVKDSYGISKDQDDALKFEEQLIENSSDRTWPLYKIKNDPRKTKIGAFIEKWSIDELPQLMNVIKWEMSLVWPRPHQPREVEKYDFRENRVLTIKPWITGMAQVNWREKNTFEDEVRLDIFYIENWSLLLDLKIILKTISVVFRRGFKK